MGVQRMGVDDDVILTFFFLLMKTEAVQREGRALGHDKHDGKEEKEGAATRNAGTRAATKENNNRKRGEKRTPRRRTVKGKDGKKGGDQVLARIHAKAARLVLRP